VILALAISGCGRVPRVVETFPPDGSRSSATSWIGIEFEMEMNRPSVEANFRISPPVEGTFQWDDHQVWFVPKLPLTAGEIYAVILDDGAQSASGNALRSSSRWTFSVREPSLLYFAPVEGPAHLWKVDPKQAVPPEEIVIEVEGELLDYAVRRDGSALVYVVENAQGGSDLYLGEREAFRPVLLLNCAEDRCSNPVWAPTGQRVAFGRATASPNSVSGFDPPRLWTVELHTHSASELLHDDHVLLGSASWSPDEHYLAFYDRTLDAIRILDLETGREQVLPTGQGLMGSWSPDGSQMVFPVLESGDEEFFVTLHRVDLRTRESTVIMGVSAGWRDVGQPQWSPNGEWICVGLQNGSGRQLWLIRPDGSELQPIETDPDYTYGGMHWGAWAESIVYQRYSLGATISSGEGETTEIFLWSLAEGTTDLIARNAWKPNWLP
jgi:Tol biopolymer transport system component